VALSYAALIADCHSTAQYRSCWQDGEVVREERRRFGSVPSWAWLGLSLCLCLGLGLVGGLNLVDAIPS